METDPGHGRLPNRLDDKLRLAETSTPADRQVALMAAAFLAYRQSGRLNELLVEARNGCAYLPDLLHQRAKTLLNEGKAHEAWLVLLQTSVA